MENLENYLQSNDDYEIIKMSGLLRKLLLDSDPLTNQINRYKKLDIKFEINEYDMPQHLPKKGFWSVEDDFDPERGMPIYRKIHVSLENLLKQKIMIINQHEITVRDLIKHLAHVEGGIHAGNPRDTKQELLKELGAFFSLAGLPAGLRLMRTIGTVVYRGLLPLKG